MLTLRRSQERGYANHGWLKSHHSFSFAGYHDPAHMGFGALRVINEDRVAPGAGFGTHGHRDMEIISYVIDGGLAHRDSLGNGSVLKAGDVQCMSAGRGVLHAEYNGSTEQPVHFLQIWIEPNILGTEPGYEEKHFAAADKRGQLRLIASEDGAAGSMRMQQDAKLYAGLLDGDESASMALQLGRQAYVHLIRGRLRVNGELLQAGDAAMLTDTDTLVLDQGDGAEVLVFDLAAT
jgi:hypothetical protein